MRHTILVLCVLMTVASCDRWGSCESNMAWALPLVRAQYPGEGAEALARVAADGSVIVAIADQSQFDGRNVEGHVIAKVSAAGQILTLQAAPWSRVYQLGADAHGGMVVSANVQSPRSMALISYDADLALRWQTPAIYGRDQPMAVGPDGDVALFDQDSSGQRTALVVVGADGLERWRSPLVDMRILALHVLPSGDVLAIGYDAVGDKRWTFAAADGTRRTDVGWGRPLTYPSNPTIAFAADGSGAQHWVDDGGRSVIERFDAAGETRWTQRPDAAAVSELRFASNGELLAVVLGGHQDVVRFDDVTGEQRARVETCAAVRIAGGDERGAVTIGPVGSPSAGLVRFDDR